MRAPIQSVECFHLVFLRLLEARVPREWWVVKGDVNLRAWFGSLRYSEDLDIDAVRGSAHALREKVDKIAASPAFREMLAAQGMAVARVSRPKQTETTQRWKFELAAGGDAPLHTRVEFSRRGTREEYALEPARAEIARAYGLAAPTANHYTASSAARQKIEAIAGRREPQGRDLWDLEHLLRTANADIGPLTPSFRETVAAALERILASPLDELRAQVVPFLPAGQQEIHSTPDAWRRICELVVDRLTERMG